MMEMLVLPDSRDMYKSFDTNHLIPKVVAFMPYKINYNRIFRKFSFSVNVCTILWSQTYQMFKLTPEEMRHLHQNHFCL